MPAEPQLVNPGEHLEVLRRIAAQMTISRDVGEVLRAITSALVTTADLALARIWLYGKPGNCGSCAAAGCGVANSEDPALHLAASAGPYSHVDGAHHRIAVGESKIGQIAETRRLMWIDDVESDPRVMDKEWVRQELLGHERGAFTNAHARRIGRFELADKSWSGGGVSVT